MWNHDRPSTLIRDTSRWCWCLKGKFARSFILLRCGVLGTWYSKTGGRCFTSAPPGRWFVFKLRLSLGCTKLHTRRSSSRVSLPLDREFSSKMIMYTVADDHMGDNEIAQVYISPGVKMFSLPMSILGREIVSMYLDHHAYMLVSLYRWLHLYAAS